jgi:hypothetical protein
MQHQQLLSGGGRKWAISTSSVLSWWLVGGRPQQQLSPDAGADALGPHQMNTARMLSR